MRLYGLDITPTPAFGSLASYTDRDRLKETGSFEAGPKKPYSSQEP
jgi:hypothetical protein